MALSHINRQLPNGIALDDGYQTVISFQSDPDIAFWEKTVKPPGYDGGEPIDTTTMHNTRWRTRRARALITMTDLTLTVAYDPVLYSPYATAGAIINILNAETVVTVTFPDESQLSFYGFLRTFEPNPHEEGAQPEATISITVTNQDFETGLETAPILLNKPSS